MDTETELRIQKLEKEMNDVYTVLKLADKRLVLLEKHDDNHQVMLRCLKDMVDAQHDLIKSLHLDTKQMRDAYYQVFPERLEQDARLGKQLKAMTTKPASGGDPTKA